MADSERSLRAGRPAGLATILNMLITLPFWLSRLPLIRDRIFQPKLMLRADPCLHVVRWGLAPDGQEMGFGSTANQTLKECQQEYREVLSHMGVTFCAPLKIEGYEFCPLPERKNRFQKV